jgi:hypothetical protein
MATLLELPDQPITLQRAADLSGLNVGTLRVQVRRGKLKIVRFGHERLTTRRLLHDYLISRNGSRGGQPTALPADYVPPDTAEAAPPHGPKTHSSNS